MAIKYQMEYDARDSHRQVTYPKNPIPLSIPVLIVWMLYIHPSFLTLHIHDLYLNMFRPFWSLFHEHDITKSHFPAG